MPLVAPPPLPAAGMSDPAYGYIWNMHRDYEAALLTASYTKSLAEKNVREEAAQIQYRKDYLLAMKAHSDALASFAGGEPHQHTEDSLACMFAARMVADWGMSGRGANSVMTNARQLAQAFLAAYPPPQ